MTVDPDSPALAANWAGHWPRVLPADMPRWLLHRLAIYLATALLVSLACMFLAARLAGHPVEAYAFLLLGGAGLFGRQMAQTAFGWARIGQRAGTSRPPSRPAGH